MFGEQVFGRRGNELGERLDPGLVRNAQVLVAAPVDHGCALLVDLGGEPRRQCGLADAGLAAQQHHAPFALRADRLPRRGELFVLVGTTDEVRGDR
jgi:hypothetical protein